MQSLDNNPAASDRDHDGAPERSNMVTARVAAAGTAVLLVGFMVMSVSRAAFVATTDNTGNSASTGDLILTDDDGTVALFTNLTNAAPGDSEESCILVTSDSDSLDPSEIKLYSPAAPTGDIAPYLDIKIEVGTAVSLGDFNDCTGFIADGAPKFNDTLTNFAALTDYAGGVATGWDPADAVGEESRAFRITTTVKDVAGGANRTGTWGFQWETQGS